MSRGTTDSLDPDLFAAAKTFDAQKIPETRKHENVSALPLENVLIEAQGVVSFFSNLSLDHDIPIGLEVASNDNSLAMY